MENAGEQLNCGAQPARRYAQLTEVNYLHKLEPLQLFITVAAFVTMAAQFFFLINLFWSIFRGNESNPNPWRATTLEWEPLEAGGEVQRWAYEFGGDYDKKDFLPQAGLIQKYEVGRKT